MNKLENIKNIKYKLSIYNKINYYQLLLINDINSTIINIVNNCRCIYVIYNKLTS